MVRLGKSMSSQRRSQASLNFVAHGEMGQLLAALNRKRHGQRDWLIELLIYLVLKAASTSTSWI